MEGTKETKEMLSLVIAIGNGIGKSLGDGRLSISDLKNFIGVLDVSKDAVKGASKIPRELADLDAKEKAELIQFVKVKFDIPQDRIEQVVESALAAAINFGDLIGLLMPKKS